ncbi:MAG: lamin tail domain-containing protein [Ignavibacteria bacterium]|nr:lamin tail domain-containing protein [Ignavibacteria bacterium]
MKLLVSLLFLLTFNKLFSQIFINEIFPAPNSNQSEWIELINPSETNVLLNGLIITNRNSSIKVNDNIVIPPNSMFLIMKDTIGFSNSLSCNYIKCLLPTLHNDWESLTIRNLDSTLIDSIFYTSKLIKRGFSIERYDWSEAGFPENLYITYDSSGNTICRENSKVIKDFELIQTTKFDTGRISFKIVNNGRYNVKNLAVKVTINYRKEHNIFEKLFFSDTFSLLPKKDTIIIVIPIIKFFAEEEAELIKTIHLYYSFDSLNKKVSKDFETNLYIPKPFTNVLLNEFLFDSHTGCGEFIELLNFSFDTINLNDWLIVNSSGKKIELDGEKGSFYLPPSNYFVIIWDSAFYNCYEELKSRPNFFVSNSNFSLRNTGDQIILYNKIGMVHDSLTFYPEWHKGKLTSYKQKSLEKLIPTQKSYLSENWFTCVDPKGATPGELNSVSFDKNEKIQISIEPDPFSPNSPNKSQAKITYILPFIQARITVKIFDLSGFEIVTLLNNQISPSSGEFFWDGKTKNGNIVQPGGYIIFFQAIDAISGETSTKKTVITVGW